MQTKKQKQEKALAYEICECGKFAFLMDAESVASLPNGYAGELCPSCNLWMCAIDKLPNAACAGLAPTGAQVSEGPTGASH